MGARRSDRLAAYDQEVLLRSRRIVDRSFSLLRETMHLVAYQSGPTGASTTRHEPSRPRSAATGRSTEPQSEKENE